MQNFVIKANPLTRHNITITDRKILTRAFAIDPRQTVLLVQLYFHDYAAENYFNILVLNGVHKAAVKACLSYPNNAIIQAAAFSCLAALSKYNFLHVCDEVMAITHEAFFSISHVNHNINYNYDIYDILSHAHRGVNV